MSQNVRWLHFPGVGFLCGIGFMTSLFIAGLTFAEGGAGYAGSVFGRHSLTRR